MFNDAGANDTRYDDRRLGSNIPPTPTGGASATTITRPRSFGFKLAQRGFNAQTAADNQLIFSSSWPLLKIAYSGSVTIDDLTLEQQIFQHNLGYPALFAIFGDDEGQSRYGTNSDMSFFLLNFGVNNYELRYFPSPSSVSKSAKLFYYIYYLDITKNYQAPTIRLASNFTSTSSKNFGMKVALPNKKATSNDLRDFSVHSNSRSPLIHQVLNGTMTQVSPRAAYSLLATHGLGYSPIFYGFMKPDTSDYYQALVTSTAGTPAMFVSNNFVEIVSAISGTASVVIMKDPFLVGENKKVTT